MIETAKQVAEFLAPVLPEIGIIVLSLVLSWGGTQAVKYVWRGIKFCLAMLKHPFPNGIFGIAERYAFKVIAVGLCFAPLYQMWERPYPFWVALCVSVLSPAIYEVTAKRAYTRWPWLEGFLSVNPSIRVDYDDKGNIVAVKLGDDKTEILGGKP